MFLHTTINSLLKIIFPVRCLSCKSSGSYFCGRCLSECPMAERETLEWIFPIFDYRHPPVKKAIWLIKYKGKKKLAGIFGEILYGAIQEELSDLQIFENFKNPVLIPIPLSKTRLRERGFNQAGLLCAEIIKTDQGKYLRRGENILFKVKETEHQARIKNRGERLKNISGSFAVKNAEAIKDKNIILIDDVTTTGATLTEARKILKQSGARKIIAFTIAH